MLSFAQLLTFIMRAEKVTSVMVGNQLEHRSMRGFAQTVTSRSLSALVCGAPHPYMVVHPTTGFCVPGTMPGGGTYPTVTQTQVDDWNELADAVYFWMLRTGYSSGRQTQSLSTTYFSSVIVPLVTKNQCHVCHNGSGAGPVMDRNFLSYSDWVTSPALVSTTPFVTRMGQALIRSETRMRSLQVDSKTSHVVRFFVPQTCEGSDLVPRSLTTGTQPVCPGPPALCKYPDAATCTVKCTASTAGDSSTAPKCTTWRIDVQCRVPRLECTGAISCPPPTVVAVGSCLENQPSTTCGPGSTVWRCEDPMNPGAPVPVQYSVSTYFEDPVTGDSHEYRSGGALP
jgi:hypothetical protein